MSAHLPSFVVIAIDVVADNDHRPICTLFERDKAIELRDALDRERDEFQRRRAVLEEQWKSQRPSQEAVAPVAAALGALSPQQVASVLNSLVPQQAEVLQQLINEAAPQQPPLPVDGVVGPVTAASILFTGVDPAPDLSNQLLWDQTNNRLGIVGGSAAQLTDSERSDVAALVQELGMTDAGWFERFDRRHGPIYELWESSDDPSRENILIHDGTGFVDPPSA